ncbi:NTP transferase domain-containing protein [Candidatus Woesearchaeota archaeon]|nr:NTP transferase domain-containing protein [Candidatus Woesearchaeota archaeon]
MSGVNTIVSQDDRSAWPVVLLCGGKGTRMWPLTEDVPKPLIPIGGKPILWHIMDRYSSYGYTHFIVCLGHMKEKIRSYFANPANINPTWKIELVDTGEESSKSERIAQVKHLIKTDHFLLSYGDDLSSVDINHVVDTHLSRGKMVTLTSVPLHSEFGVLELDDKHHVRSFREKPRLSEYWINGGFYVCNKQVLSNLEGGEFEDVVLKKLAAAGEVTAYKFEGFWKCMNTSKEAIEFNKMWDEGKVLWKKG